MTGNGATEDACTRHIGSESDTELHAWVFSSADLAELAEDLCRYSYECQDQTRNFQNRKECDEFMKRVQTKEAKALVFKDFNYHGKVEREIWFHDPQGPPGLQYVIVHIHFNDIYDQERHEKRQQQLTHTVTAINLRHCKLIQSKNHKKAGFYESIFQKTYLEDGSMTIKQFQDGWKWKEMLQANDLDGERMQCLQTEKMKGVHHYHNHKGDKRLDLPEFVASLQKESEAAGTSMVELANELETLNRFMDILESDMRTAPLQDFVYNFKTGRDCQDQGIEVLTMGNNNYSLVGLRHGGRLKNADAHMYV
jgi:hypothetical protein